MRYQISNFELLKQMLEQIPDDDSCLVWPRGYNRQGYGQLQNWDKKREYLVHRQAWIETNGLIPDGLFVCHRCDNPPCFRPDHLFLGDQTANMRDCANKGRKWIPPTRLTPKQRQEVRHLYAAGAKQTDLAVQFNVSRAVINDATAGLFASTQYNGINARFTPDDIREIRRLHAQGMRQTKIAAQFGTKQGTISKIVLRKAWHWL